MPQYKTFTTTAEEPVENPTKGVFEYLKIINQRITGNLLANTPADSASRFFLYKLMASKSLNDGGSSSFGEEERIISEFKQS